jgi:hypothetical protein
VNRHAVVKHREALRGRGTLLDVHAECSERFTNVSCRSFLQAFEVEEAHVLGEELLAIVSVEFHEIGQVAKTSEVAGVSSGLEFDTFKAEYARLSWNVDRCRFAREKLFGPIQVEVHDVVAQECLSTFRELLANASDCPVKRLVLVGAEVEHLEFDAEVLNGFWVSLNRCGKAGNDPVL